MRKTLRSFSIATLVGMVANPVFSAPLAFDITWKEQGFLRLWTNDYALRGAQVDIVSDGTVSLLYRPVPQPLWGATAASWQWTVSQSVGATDLGRKGDDDRNLAIYFVFVDRESAAKLSRRSARRLLKNRNTRALVYVWGGMQARGTIESSPYAPTSLKTIYMRPPGTGSFAESVDLAADFARAFGEQRGVLVGIGITADSDDTDGKIVASIADLSVN